MDKTVRNETGANLALAESAHSIAQTRADWRAVLAARDLKRDARRATMLHNMRRQSAERALLASQLFAIALSVLVVIGGVL